MGGPSGEAVEAIEDAFPELIAVQPVLLLHIGVHAGETFGKKRLAAGQLSIRLLGKSVQAAGFGELGRVGGQKMVEYDVDERAGIKSVVGPEPRFCFLCHGMEICKAIYSAVEVDTMTDGKWVVQLFFPFYKITDHVADGNICDAEG